MPDPKFNKVPAVVSSGEAFVVCSGRTDAGRDYEVWRFDRSGASPTFLLGNVRKLEAMNKARGLNEKRQA